MAGDITSTDGTKRYGIVWLITTANNKPALVYRPAQDLVQGLPNDTVLYSADAINDRQEITGLGVTYTGNPPVADQYIYVITPDIAPPSSP